MQNIAVSYQVGDNLRYSFLIESSRRCSSYLARSSHTSHASSPAPAHPKQARDPAQSRLGGQFSKLIHKLNCIIYLSIKRLPPIQMVESFSEVFGAHLFQLLFPLSCLSLLLWCYLSSSFLAPYAGDTRLTALRWMVRPSRRIKRPQLHLQEAQILGEWADRRRA